MTKYSNSLLVDFTLLSPNYSSGRIHRTLNPEGVIDKITIHHMAGNLTVESCGRVFQPTSRKASSNYGVDNNGRIGMYVEEKNRAWTSSKQSNDIRAVTIEVANDGGRSSGWHVSDVALEATIKLCIDICKRNSIKEINFTGDASGSLTMHKWFSNTECPGPYLESKFPYIAEQINLALGSSVENEDTLETTVTETRIPSKMAGRSVTLEECNLYTASTSSRRHSRITGTYYVWSDEIINNRVKITHDKSLVGVKGRVTGWVNYSSVKSQVEGPVLEESVVPPVTPEVVESVDKWIWDFLSSKGLNDYAKAGIIGNLYAESGLKSTNLQNSYEDDFGHDDSTYTSAVDSGVYTNFVNDKAGYGLAQWTYHSRKENLLNFAKSEGKSIGSLSMQMDFFWKEIQGFSRVIEVLKSATSIREASNAILFDYENPADKSEKIQDQRESFGQKYFDKFTSSTSVGISPDPTTPSVPSFENEDDDKNVVETTSVSYQVKVSISDLNIRKGPGTNYDKFGVTGEGTFTIVEEADGPGATRWGLLKTYQESRDGWISLDFATRLGQDLGTIKKGDRVKLKTSAVRWTTGKSIPSWVKMRTLFVRSNPSSNGTCQVSTLKVGDITGVIEIKHIQKV